MRCKSSMILSVLLRSTVARANWFSVNCSIDPFAASMACIVSSRRFIQPMASCNRSSRVINLLRSAERITASSTYRRKSSDIDTWLMLICEARALMRCRIFLSRFF
uniref:Putative secreted protein n=1 Tax=Anopheles darlingi TaxID=43151 RepID=A0A2M4DAH1_ANODA